MEIHISTLLPVTNYLHQFLPTHIDPVIATIAVISLVFFLVIRRPRRK
jgi:ABC-type transport system involved in cytochrome bd biosynthesis fused ATPase/permease subunit